MSQPPRTLEDLITAVASPAPIRFPARSAAAAGAPSDDGSTRKKRRGPKPKSAEEQRTHCVSVRLNAAELAALDKRRGEFQRGEWMRLAEQGALPPPAPPALNVEAWQELARAAGNLNQIARALNGNPDLVEARAVLEELRQFRAALLGAEPTRPARPPKASP